MHEIAGSDGRTFFAAARGEEPFAAAVRQVRLRPPSIRMSPRPTGTWITAEEAADPDYWIRHLTDSVRFADGMTLLVQEPRRLFVEIGPGHDLTLLAARHLGSGREQQALNLVRPASAADRTAPCWSTDRQAVGCTASPSIAAFHGEARAIVSLPSYPFARERYWPQASGGALAAPGTGRSKGRPASGQMGKEADMSDWFYVPTWKKSPPPQAGKETPPQAGRKTLRELACLSPTGADWLQTLSSISPNEEPKSLQYGQERGLSKKGTMQ